MKMLINKSLVLAVVMLAVTTLTGCAASSNSTQHNYGSQDDFYNESTSFMSSDGPAFVRGAETIGQVTNRVNMCPPGYRREVDEMSGNATSEVRNRTGRVTYDINVDAKNIHGCEPIPAYETMGDLPEE